MKLSALGCEDPDKFYWAKEHLEAEKYLTQIGLPVTSLRPASFHANWFSNVPTIKSQVSVEKDRL